MKKIQIIELRVLVPTGTPAELVGDLPHHLGVDGLNQDRFTPKPTDPEPWRDRQGIVAWPTETVERNLWLVNYPGRYFENYSAAHECLRENDFPLVGFPELCALKSKTSELWDMGVLIAASTSPDSFWRSGDGSLCVPCLNCSPCYRKLDAHWVGHGWNSFGWLVVGGK